MIPLCELSSKLSFHIRNRDLDFNNLGLAPERASLNKTLDSHFEKRSQIL